MEKDKLKEFLVKSIKEGISYKEECQQIGRGYDLDGFAKTCVVELFMSDGEAKLSEQQSNCNKTAVSIALPTQSELQETVEKIAYTQLAAEQIDDLVCKMQILDEFVKKYLKAVGNEC